MADTIWNADSVRAALGRVSWYHSFEVFPGIVTPGSTGLVDARGWLNLFALPEDLRGVRALDIGTWDGPLAFELERRGATVTAVDIQDPDLTGFNTAKAILGSSVEYVQSDVGRMPARLRGTFDLVIYFGVFYHLKDPIGAFESISAVMHEESRLCIEGEALVHYAEALGGSPDPSLPLEAIGASRVPIALCYPGRYKQAPNWFIPNVACLESWLQAAGLALVSHRIHTSPFPRQRITGTARKVSAPIEEHGLVQRIPDAE